MLFMKGQKALKSDYYSNLIIIVKCSGRLKLHAKSSALSIAVAASLVTYPKVLLLPKGWSSSCCKFTKIQAIWNKAV